MTNSIDPVTHLPSAQDYSIKTNHPFAHIPTHLDQNQGSTDEINEHEVKHLTRDRG
jgi:hypothetical protein